MENLCCLGSAAKEIDVEKKNFWIPEVFGLIFPGKDVTVYNKVTLSEFAHASTQCITENGHTQSYHPPNRFKLLERRDGRFLTD